MRPSLRNTAPEPSLSGKKREFFLSDVTIKRLGGPQAGELMKLLVIDRMSPRVIQERLGLTPGEFDVYVLTHYFQRELKAQLRNRDEGDGAHKYSAINKAISKKPLVAIPTQYKITLKPGQSPQEWALGRLNSVTPEAVEKLIYLMHNARQESVQYNAAVKLLGLNGLVEVEKSISIIADAEAVIRELNRRGPYKKTPEAETEEVNDAEIILDDAKEEIKNEGGGVECPDESGPAPTPLEEVLVASEKVLGSLENAL